MHIGAQLHLEKFLDGTGAFGGYLRVIPTTGEPAGVVGPFQMLHTQTDVIGGGQATTNKLKLVFQRVVVPNAEGALLLS